MMAKEKIQIILCLWGLMWFLAAYVWMDKYSRLKQELERLKKLH